MVRIGLLLVALLVPSFVAAQQVSAPHDTLRGAVRVVNPRARTLEVTTGVGLALRVVRLVVPADVPAALGELRPGDIVRVTYGARPPDYVAYSIERVGRMDAGPERSP